MLQTVEKNKAQNIVNLTKHSIFVSWIKKNHLTSTKKLFGLFSVIRNFEINLQLYNHVLFMCLVSKKIMRNRFYSG